MATQEAFDILKLFVVAEVRETPAPGTEPVQPDTSDDDDESDEEDDEDWDEQEDSS